MKSRFLINAAFAVCATSSAFAADLPSRQVKPVAPVAPAFTWQGFYVGLNAGYGGNEVSHPITFGRRSTVATPVGALNLTTSGGLVGAQVGYNYQMGAFVVGAEADFSFANIEGSQNLLGTGLFPGGAGGGPTRASLSTKIETLGTVRLRLGYAWDRALFYVTGGWAYGNINGGIVATGAQALNIDYSKSNWHNGWTLGAGVEYAFTNNITFKTEYLYADLGNATVYQAVYRSGTNVKLETDVAAHIVRVGLNYKF